MWREIKAAAGVDLEAFVACTRIPTTSPTVWSTLPAPRCTSRRRGAARLRKHWILYTARRGYGAIFDTMGRTLPEFLANLDMMHARLSLSMPEMRPPSFVSEQLSDHQIRLEYWSERAGLAPMVIGLLEGLGEMYSLTVSIVQTVDRANGADHDEFLIDHHPDRADWLSSHR